MIFSRPAEFVTRFVEEIDEAVRREDARSRGLSSTQRCWLAVCVMAVIITNSVCWARFARACLGRYSQVTLCWIFVHAAIAWEQLLQASVTVVLREHGISEGTLVIDDTDKRRSKSTTRIWGVSKLRDKTSGGYIQGQCIVFLLLVTPSITLPVGFRFYRPDPACTAWAEQDKTLKRQGVPKKNRPPRPARNLDYPTKIDLALRLLEQFKRAHAQVRVKAVLADALYNTAHFLDTASQTMGNIQVVSQLRCNQQVRFRGRECSVSQYFKRQAGVPRTLQIRGDKEQTAIVNSARLHVSSHGKKRFVIALRYEGEDTYRYLVASDLTWRTEDIIRLWTLRWLVEVFFEDWKAHEGWNALTKQRGEDGSRRSLTLSLLVDHCLLLHPDQLARMKHKQPAYTVGSLTDRIRAEAIVAMVKDVVASPDTQEQVNMLVKVLREQFALQPSRKHMIGRDLGNQEPSPHLRHRAETG
jgi:hypothetical protein